MIEAHGLIDTLYRGVTDEGQFERALGLLGDRLGCRSTALVSLDAGQPRADLIFSTGVFDAAARARHLAEFAAHDPAPHMFARMAPGSASSTDRLLSPERRRESVFLNEFFRPLGLVDTIGGLLRVGDGRFEMIGLHRGPDRAAFDDEELAGVERLLPHLARALQLRRTFLAQEVRIASLEAGLDGMAAGIVLFDAAGTALFANAAMRAIAAHEDGLGLGRSGRLVVSDGQARRRVDLLLAGLARGEAGGVVAVPRRGGARPYAVLIAPLPQHFVEGLLDRARAGGLAIVHDPAERPTVAAALLREALGLTPGAAAVALALAGEDDLKSFAERQGITIHTARFHLRAALARTGARTQAELVRLVVGLLRDLRLRQG